MAFSRHVRDAFVCAVPSLRQARDELHMLRQQNAALQTAITQKAENSPFYSVVQGLMELSQDELNTILSTDPTFYAVGDTNTQDREAWTSNALRNLPPGLRLLDAGAGESMYRKDCAHLDYVSQDIAQYDGEGDKGLHTGEWDTSKIDIVSDIVAIPEPDASFDAALCTEVLEHAAMPVSALEELARLLKPRGTLIVTAPFWSLTHFAPYHYATGFNRYFFEHHLGRLGFDIVELTPNGNYFESIAQEVRRIPEMATKFSTAKIDTLEQYAMQIVLRMMQRLSGGDRGSDEVLYYGSLVRAVKKA